MRRSREPTVPIAINIPLGSINGQQWDSGHLLGSILGGLMDHLIYDRGFIPIPVEQISNHLARQQLTDAKGGRKKCKKATKVLSREPLIGKEA